uniref:ATP synthase epsilon chain, chloroplastic n=1 Tax=Cyanidium caldarium TaxID=2771 RepID=ATPE_CYACA|nr:ATP synthase CF1 epsilon subunit [Cyanidium caldarium]Q9TM40.1 RecName: Full=ATP synthase epsilon chain, chloroplastic; AltName: Full=ATP synthase F1 sector epsilon subunit; AltName: Full=F-ATPase epsilon subunit [Cyanidium caldarium]AAF13019.1 unknown [Cyanidium caldarium]WDB00153.1 ATP synthase CF1 epsilon subunit [Cyanidium caldarium]
MALTVKVITPDRVVWKKTVEEIILPSSTGQLGILMNHAPLLTALDIGVMRARMVNTWVPLVLLGGFAQIDNNLVTIIVSDAEEVKAIDEEEANKLLAASLANMEKAQSNREKIESMQNLRRARARMQAILSLK